MYDFTEACSQIMAEINRLLQTHQPPILVAVDGGSGAGKSTLASVLGQQVDAVIVQIDDFFSASIPDWEWDARSVQERVRDIFDWKRLRIDALAPLLANQVAKWDPLDFAAGLRPDGTYALSQQAVQKHPAPVIILEGAYSSNPEIADLIDLTVFIDIPVPERHQRLEKREGDRQFLQRWHTLWDPAEEYYFSEVMPKSAFDVVVSGSSTFRA